MPFAELASGGIGGTIEILVHKYGRSAGDHVTVIGQSPLTWSLKGGKTVLKSLEGRHWRWVLSGESPQPLTPRKHVVKGVGGMIEFLEFKGQISKGERLRVVGASIRGSSWIMKRGRSEFFAEKIEENRLWKWVSCDGRVQPSALPSGVKIGEGSGESPQCPTLRMNSSAPVKGIGGIIEFLQAQGKISKGELLTVTGESNAGRSWKMSRGRSQF